MIQAAVEKEIRPRAEAQRRWVSKGVAALAFSASQRLCARTYLVPAGGGYLGVRISSLVSRIALGWGPRAGSGGRARCPFSMATLSVIPTRSLPST